MEVSSLIPLINTWLVVPTPLKNMSQIDSPIRDENKKYLKPPARILLMVQLGPKSPGMYYIKNLVNLQGFQQPTKNG